MKFKILVVEDETDIRRLIRLILENEGYRVLTAENAEEGIRLFDRDRPDFVILDVLLPGMDGLQLCAEMRRSSNVPVLFLSCRRDAEDIVAGHDCGGDDYMTKPFDPAVLAAKVRAGLRRVPVRMPKRDILRVGRLQADFGSREIFLDGEPIPLFAKELQLLFFLMKHAGQVFSAVQLYEQIWGMGGDSEDQTVKVHISTLRKKLDDDPVRSNYIQTVRGFGYKFVRLS
ncbi:response regulator transcription factor [Cohnella faecalis]|nr:response regulator transcription factor [Cohnella faecalis]